MRVLLLSGEYPPRLGGVGDFTHRLSQALARTGIATRVLTAAFSGLTDRTSPPAWRRVTGWGPLSWPSVARAVAAHDADILNIQYQPGAFQLNGAVNLLPLALRLLSPRVRVVTTFHDLRVPYLFPKAGAARRWAVEALLRTSQTAIFVDSEDLATAGTAPNRSWIPIGSNIPNAPGADFDRTALRRRLGAEDGTLLLGFFGFLSASKGALTLLESTRALLDAGRATRLVLIGAGAGDSNPSDAADVAAVQTLLGDLRLGQHVVETGYLTAAAVSEHLLACDLIVLPYQDGASLRRGSLLAALEHGCAILTTEPRGAAGGLGERALIAGKHVLTVPPDDVAALTAAIARLTDDSALARRLGQAAAALARQFDWDKIAAETLEVYEMARSGISGR